MPCPQHLPLPPPQSSHTTAAAAAPTAASSAAATASGSAGGKHMLQGVRTQAWPAPLPLPPAPFGASSSHLLPPGQGPLVASPRGGFGGWGDEAQPAMSVDVSGSTLSATPIAASVGGASTMQRPGGGSGGGAAGAGGVVVGSNTTQAARPKQAARKGDLSQFLAGVLDRKPR
eukprot:171052-Chlamydomonas_euryale.AAC.1